MAQTAKKTTAAPLKDAEQTPLEHMPTPPPKPAKSEHLFIAWTGQVLKGGADAEGAVRIDDMRVFGRKDLCTEFAVDQEPAWKWVQTAKGESVASAILAKAGR